MEQDSPFPGPDEFLDDMRMSEKNPPPNSVNTDDAPIADTIDMSQRHEKHRLRVKDMNHVVLALSVLP